eukprot:5166632-Amphidinium_carterae.1
MSCDMKVTLSWLDVAMNFIEAVTASDVQSPFLPWMTIPNQQARNSLVPRKIGFLHNDLCAGKFYLHGMPSSTPFRCLAFHQRTNMCKAVRSKTSQFL